MEIQLEGEHCQVTIIDTDKILLTLEDLPGFLTGQEAVIKSVTLDIQNMGKVNSEIVAAIVQLQMKLKKIETSIKLVAGQVLKQPLETVMLSKIIEVEYR